MPSCMQRIGTPNARHNFDIKYRAQLENVDPPLSKYNEVLQRKSVNQIYEEKLQPAFDAFNKRQKRKDRRLDVKYNCTTALEYQHALDKRHVKAKMQLTRKGALLSEKLSGNSEILSKVSDAEINPPKLGKQS